MVAKKKVTRWSPSQKKWVSSWKPVSSVPSKPAKRRPTAVSEAQYRTIKEDIAKGRATPSMRKEAEKYESAKKAESPISRVEYAKGAGDTKVQIIYYKDGRREVVKYKPTTSETLYKVRVPTKAGTKTIYMSKGAVGKYSQYAEEQRQMTAAEKVKQTPKSAIQRAGAKIGEWNVAGAAWLKSKGFPEWEKTRMGSKEESFTFSKVKEGKLPLGSWLVGRLTLAWYGDVHERMRTKPATFAIETGAALGAGAIISPVASKGYSVVMKGAAKYGSKAIFAGKAAMGIGGTGAAAAWVVPKGGEFLAAPTEKEKGRVLASATREYGLFSIGADLTKSISTRALGKGLVYEQIGHLKDPKIRKSTLKRWSITEQLAREQPPVGKYQYPETWPKKYQSHVSEFFRQKKLDILGSTVQPPQKVKMLRKTGDIDLPHKDPKGISKDLFSFLTKRVKGAKSELVWKGKDGVAGAEGYVFVNPKGKPSGAISFHEPELMKGFGWYTSKRVKTPEGIKMETLGTQALRKQAGALAGRGEKDIIDYPQIMKTLFKTKATRIKKDILPFKKFRLEALGKTKAEFYATKPTQMEKQLRWEKPFDPSVKMPKELTRPFDFVSRTKVLKKVSKTPHKTFQKDMFIEGGGGKVRGYYDIGKGEIAIRKPAAPALRFIKKREISGTILHEATHKAYYTKGAKGAPSKSQILSDYAKAYKTKDFGVGEVGQVVGQVKGKQLFQFIDKSYKPKYRKSEYLSYYAEAHPEQIAAPTTATGRYLKELYRKSTPSKSLRRTISSAGERAYAKTTSYKPPKSYKPSITSYKPPITSYKPPKTPSYKPPKTPSYKPPRTPSYTPPRTPTYKPPKYPPTKVPPYKPPYSPPSRPPPTRITGILPALKPRGMKIKLFAQRKYHYTPSLRFAFGIPAKYKVPKMRVLTGIEERPFKRRRSKANALF